MLLLLACVAATLLACALVGYAVVARSQIEPPLPPRKRATQARAPRACPRPLGEAPQLHALVIVHQCRLIVVPVQIEQTDGVVAQAVQALQAAEAVRAREEVEELQELQELRLLHEGRTGSLGSSGPPGPPGPPGLSVQHVHAAQEI